MLLDVKNLKTYLRAGQREVRAVDDVSFRIDRGQTFCLVGESGSGKSISALSVIQLLPSGVAHHPSGEVLFNHRRDDGSHHTVNMLTLDDETKRQIRGARISMIFQEPMTSLNPVYTVGEQIMEALFLHRPGISHSEARERAINALAQVKIADPQERVDEYPHRLSGGQRQRVMIAMAMACEPDLLIADEPTTALDVTVQAEILRLMRELQERRGMAILFITHDFGVVSQMAHQVGVMKLGKLVEVGATQDIIRRPQHPYTRQLIAALPESLKQKRYSVSEHAAASSAASKRPPLVKVKDIQVHFPIKKGVFKHTVGHVKAVDGVDLTIRQGEIVSLVGESGCGKTTLGRALLRLVDPTGGSIVFNDTDITKLHRKELQPLRPRMQFIFQDPMSSLNPRLTIAGTLTEPMEVHGIGANREERIAIAERVMAQVQLETEHLWRYPHEFSGGQKQRIGIARALVLKPQFIVCDEITSALDVSVQAEILDLLLSLRDQYNLTLLFITHNIAVVEYISDVTAVMHDGKIVEHGPTDRISAQPEHPYTQKLLAAVPRVTL